MFLQMVKNQEFEMLQIMILGEKDIKIKHV